VDIGTAIAAGIVSEHLFLKFQGMAAMMAKSLFHVRPLAPSRFAGYGMANVHEFGHDLMRTCGVRSKVLFLQFSATPEPVRIPSTILHHYGRH